MNIAQTTAAHTTASQVLCIAGPGSGKTTTLIEAVIAKARRDGPQSILCITFTNAAAQEMQTRLHKAGLVGQLGYIGTLHAFLLRLLRTNHSLVGLPKNLTVVDELISEPLLDDILGEMGVAISDEHREELLERRDLFEKIERNSYRREELAILKFHATLRQGGMLTLDALLHYGQKLALRIKEAAELCQVKTGPGDPPARHQVHWTYRHLFVDEVQDSADADFAIYKALPCWTKFLVGDPDQAIYGFRGGNVQNIIRLAADDSWERHYLEENYRCKQEIADAAQRMISRSGTRINKRTVAINQGGQIGNRRFSAPGEEIAGVASMIINHRSEQPDRTWSDYAVLARTNRRAIEFSAIMRAMGIPLTEAEQTPPPAGWTGAKLLVAALAAPNNNLIWRQMLSYVKGEKEASTAEINATMGMTSIGNHLRSTPAGAWLEGGIMKAKKALPAAAEAELDTAIAAMNELYGPDGWDVADLAASIRSGERQKGHQTTPTPGVTVTTIHQAKGREWKYVFIVGCEEGEIPQLRKDTDLDEERRLFFVGMTRAAESLLMTWCDTRPQNRGPNQPPGPMMPKTRSRFITEIEP